LGQGEGKLKKSKSLGNHLKIGKNFGQKALPSGEISRLSERGLKKKKRQDKEEECRKKEKGDFGDVPTGREARK